jgi:hypothetical protein
MIQRYMRDCRSLRLHLELVQLSRHFCKEVLRNEIDQTEKESGSGKEQGGKDQEKVQPM